MTEQAAAIWADMIQQHRESMSREPLSVEITAHRPRAAILACSDARVPPSLIFGQEPGALFVVRLAGNSATAGAVASLTFAVEQLGTELVIVLGHTGCGAIAAALADDTPAVLAPIVAPIDEMLAACDGCESQDAAVTANVRYNVNRLRRSRGPLGRSIVDGRVTVVGAVHDLRTGQLIDVTQATAVTRAHRSDSSTDHPQTEPIRSVK